MARGPNFRRCGAGGGACLEAVPARSRRVMELSNPATTAAKRIGGPGLALVLLTVLISGVSNFVNFKAVQWTNVDACSTIRNAVVALRLVPLALVLGRTGRSHLTGADWARLATIGLVGGAVPFLLYFHGFQMAAAQGGAAAASLGYRSLFLVATVFAIVVLRERLPRGFTLAAALLMAGNILLVAFSGPVWTDGTAYVLLATAMWAGEYTLSKRALRNLPSPTVALGRVGFGAIFLLGYLGLSGQVAAVGSFAAADWMTLSLSALLLFGFVATWYAGLRTVDLSVATSLLVLAFPITWVLGVLSARSPLVVEQAAGAAAIALGVALILFAASSPGTRAALARWFHARGARTE